MRQKGKATRYPGVKRIGDGNYRMRFKVRDPKTGRIKEVDRVEQCANLADAAKRREELKTEMEQAQSVQRERLATFALSWLSGKRKTLKKSTLDRYGSILATHILPALGDYFVDAITHYDVVRWRDAQEGAPGSVNSRLRVLKTLLADATVVFDLPRDPSHRVVSVRDVATDEDPNCLDGAQLAALLEAIRTTIPRWYPLFATLAFTGMRVGEATALKWQDLDETKGVIRVRRSAWRGHVDSTKTDVNRTVPLPDNLAAILRDQRRALVERQAKGLDAGWVFPSEKGTPICHASPRKPLLDALEVAGISERFTIHGFRRTFNNLMRQVAKGEVVRAVTGHVTERMTEHYSHVGVEEKSAAVSRVLEMVRPRKVGTLVGTDVGT